ncbi:MAG: bifunctional oligoribonuclease/PAP phosphatase NrnA [Bacteroidales bacterium]|nr:bifunctional oligoribonuclease/PAP phosphatase NrnA [Bacteroidales bacterium]
MKYNEYHIIAEQLSSKKNIVLSAHANPDGDTIGSCLALYHFFTQFGHQVQVIIPNEAPCFLNWLPAYKEALVFDNDKNSVKEAIDASDVVFAVDYNAFHRVGAVLDKLLEEAKGLKFLIDHHPNPSKGFDALISDTSASSTAELVYSFIQDLNQSDKINKDLGSCLYVGLLTDTGSFSYSIKTDIPFLMAAFLFKVGVDFQMINQRVYSTFTENRLRLTGYAISEKLHVIPELRFAYIALTKQELERFNHQNGDTEGLVNYALSIENSVIAVLLTEKDNKIRLSFRSKGTFAVNQIAAEYFEGGGHINAAGGNSYLSMEETIQKLLAIIPKYKQELNAIDL